MEAYPYPYPYRWTTLWRLTGGCATTRPRTRASWHGGTTATTSLTLSLSLSLTLALTLTLTLSLTLTLTLTLSLSLTLTLTLTVTRWDYGYQISGVANRTTIADGNTWNHEHIALLGA